MEQIRHNMGACAVRLILLPLVLLLNSFGLSLADKLDDHQQLDDLLNLLSEQTTLATKSRINADFVPGMMTIMTGQEMQMRGFMTLWDAMAYMPGVIRAIDATGMRSLNVRGVSQSVGSGKIRFLLNNVMINASSTSTTGTLLDTPVNQINKVEFIRGPGSAIHGEFAIAGVINVITRQQGQQVSASLGDHTGYGYHALVSLTPQDSTVSASLNIGGFDLEGETLTANDDRTPDGINGYAPGPANNKKDMLSAIAQVDWNSLSLVFQYQQSNRGDFFGRFNYLPPDRRQTVISETLYNLHLNQSLDLDDAWSVDWSLSHLRNITEKNRQFLGVAPIYGGLPGDDDIISYVDLEEHRTESHVGLHYREQRHHWYMELSHSEISIDHYRQFINLDPVSGQYSPTLNAFPPPIAPATDRTTSSLVIQDEFELTPDQTLTAGIHYDRYDDIGSHLSPRLAFVWRRSDQDIYKLQYSEAFRPPTLLELEGAIDGNIEAETIDSIEASYIKIASDYSIRNTIYRSRINHLIAFQNAPPAVGYDNFNRAMVMGYELELENQLHPNWSTTVNLTLQDIDKPESTLLLSDIPSWFVAAGIEHEINATTMAHFQVKHISDRDRNPGDDRDPLPASSQADFSIHYQKLMGIPGLQLSLSIHNLFSDTVKSAAAANTYNDDYLITNSRSWWIELKLIDFQ